MSHSFQKSKEIASLLTDSSISIEQILRNPFFIQTFQSQNQDLLERIQSPESMKEIYEIIRSCKDRSLMSILNQVFFMPNSVALHASSKDPNIAQYMSEIISNNDPQNYERIGLISQILTYSINSWPNEIVESILKNDRLLPTILSNIHLNSIFYSFIQITSISSSSLHTYLYGFISACAEKKIENITSWNIDYPGIKACFDIKLNTNQKIHVYKLITSYLKVFPDEKEFRSLIFSVINDLLDIATDQKEQAAVYNLASKLKRSSHLIEKAYQILSGDTLNLEVADAAIQYLSLFDDGSTLEPIINLIFRILNPQEFPENHYPNMFVLQGAIDLVKNISERVDSPRFFTKLIQICVAQSWNDQSGLSHDNSSFLRMNLRRRSALLQISTVINDLSSFNGWNEFQTVVVEPFSQQHEFPRDFIINVDGIDEDDLERMKRQDSEIPMKAIDRRPYVDIRFSEDSDSGNTLSGSYDEEEEDNTEPGTNLKKNFSSTLNSEESIANQNECHVI